MRTRSSLPTKKLLLFLFLLLPSAFASFLPTASSSSSHPLQSQQNISSSNQGQENFQEVAANSTKYSANVQLDASNSLSLDDYIAFLKQSNFFGTWKSSDKISRPFQSYFNNPTGLIIVETLNADLQQGGNYFARLPAFDKNIANFHVNIVPSRAYYLDTVRTWSILVKLYDGDYVDQNSANIFYQIADQSAFVLDQDNATLSITDGLVEIYLKDDSGDSSFYKRCLANFSLSFEDISLGQPYKDAIGDSSHMAVQYAINSEDCGINFTSGLLTPNGFQDTSENNLFAMISSITALIQLFGAYRIKNQLKNRKNAYKIAIGAMWMTATIDYYTLILNLVLVFAFSVIFIVPFILYMILTFYFERDNIIRIIQTLSKRNQIDINDEGCRSCSFYFGISTLLFVFELVFILMSKLWVIHVTAFIFIPQIWHNAKRDKRYSFNFYQVFLLGLIRIGLISYLKYYPSNIFKLSPDVQFLTIYSSLMISQVIILLIQTKFPRLFFTCLKRRKCRALTEEDVCPICMGDLKSEAPTIADSLLLDFEETIETPCSHVFHMECLKKWVKTKVECPVCRNKISEVLEEVGSSEDETQAPSILQL